MLMDNAHVNRATTAHLLELAQLFDDYRHFYGQQPDLAAARHFLAERFSAEDSAIFVAERAEEIVGFTQLYPTYSSVAMKQVWILNDLFVVPGVRRCGVARTLLDSAVKFAREQSATRLILATAIDNTPAKRLYETSGWKIDNVFDHYQHAL